MNKKGFTLIEILVSIGVLLVLLIMGIGGLVQVIQAHRETQAMQQTMNDLNYVMESMSRHIRFGKDYKCKNRITDSFGCDHIYTNFEGETDIEYRLNASAIERKIGGSSFEQITSSENIDIKSLSFYLGGVGKSSNTHPRVTIIIQGIVQTGGGKESTLVLQTTVNQRFNE